MIEVAPRTDRMMTYDEAWLYIATLTHNKHYDWRIPTNWEYAHYTEIPPGSWYDPNTGTHPDVWKKSQWIIIPVRTI